MIVNPSIIIQICSMCERTVAYDLLYDEKREIVRTAIGLCYICLTEHLDMVNVLLDRHDQVPEKVRLDFHHNQALTHGRWDEFKNRKAYLLDMQTDVIEEIKNKK